MPVAEPAYVRTTDHHRFYLKQRLLAGDSLRAIAADLGCAASTLSRELRRNGAAGGEDYSPAAAAERARRMRRMQAPPRAVTHSMSIIIQALMVWRGWSPEQISGRLREAGFSEAPCAVTIYKHVREDRLRGGNLFEWLRHGGKRRKRRADQEYGGLIPHRVGISERPGVVDARTRVGDWEADLIVGPGHKGALLVLLERRTGKTLATRVRNKQAATVRRAIIRLLRHHTEHVKTITFDNGREFSQHTKVARALDCDCYFADPYASCQKGSVENVNGLLRQYFPKHRRLDNVKQAEVSQVVSLLNSRPRKRLGWDTPDEAFKRETEGPLQGELWYKAA